MKIELGRFVIREINPWEAPGVFRLTGDPAVMRYMGFRTHTHEDQAAELIERYRGNHESRWLGVCTKGDPSGLIGIVGLEIRGHSATLTLMFCNDWAARGAGRAVSIPLVAWLFVHVEIWRVWAYCHVDNIPVQRVLERLGAVREGRLRRFEYFPNVSDEPQDVYMYSIVKE